MDPLAVSDEKKIPAQSLELHGDIEPYPSTCQRRIQRELRNHTEINAADIFIYMDWKHILQPVFISGKAFGAKVLPLGTLISWKRQRKF